MNNSKKKVKKKVRNKNKNEIIDFKHEKTTLRGCVKLLLFLKIKPKIFEILKRICSSNDKKKSSINKIIQKKRCLP